jgi:adenylate cyclase
MKKYFKLNPVNVSILVIVLVIIAYFYGITFLDMIELKTIDLRFNSRGKIPSGSQVVLAVIDEKSLDQEGRWVWPRSTMADLVTKISKAGAKVVAFDIGFLEPDEKSLTRTIKDIQNKAAHSDIRNAPFIDYLEQLKLQSDHDRLLAEAIKNSSAKVVLGYFFQMGWAGLGHMDEKDISIHTENSKGSMYKIVRYESSEASNVPLIEAKVPQSNIKEISSSTDFSGYFNMIPDPDGVVRRIPGVFRFNDMLYAPLSIVSAGVYLDDPISVYVGTHGVETIKIGKLSIPTDKYGQILINYRGPEKSFPHISIADILNEQIGKYTLKDKIVLVGATAQGIYDLRVSPFATAFPGLEIHANILDNILSKDFLYQPEWARLFDVLAISVAGLFLAFVLPRTGVISGAITGALLFSGHILLCHFLFSEKGWIINIIYPLAVIVILYIGITTYRYLLELRQKQFIKNAFSTYLAPSVVKHLVDSPEKLVLGGEEREITAFFSDVEGFTGISEALSPQELVELLNEFLTEMTDIILDHEGTVDKFEGDAIIAFFGAPNFLENQAETACMACIEMQKRLSKLREKWKKEGKPELLMRIGISTGPAVVGNMGSRNRMDYTMMGDTVNTAARLEGVNKVYGTYTMISETTYTAAGDWSLTRELDSINVVGKNEPVSVYQLLGYPGDVDEQVRETVDYYTRGLYFYRRRDWNKAIMFFLKALSLTPDDGPSNTMLARCNEFKTNPPGKDWNGTYSILHK